MGDKKQTFMGKQIEDTFYDHNSRGGGGGGGLGLISISGCDAMMSIIL